MYVLRKVSLIYEDEIKNTPHEQQNAQHLKQFLQEANAFPDLIRHPNWPFPLIFKCVFRAPS